MNASMIQREQLIVKAAELIEQNPSKHWPLMLQSLGYGDTADSWLLLQSIVDSLHPVNRARCIDLAAQKGLILQ